MSLRRFGKKIGKFKVSTVLADYDLDVRLNVADNHFHILVPQTPGAAILELTPLTEIDSFKAPTLEEAKKAVEEFLRGRDKTEFVDVIEYRYTGPDDARQCSWGIANNSVGFEFRVARVSIARSRGGGNSPKLEMLIDVDDDGNISLEQGFGGQPYPTQSYRRSDLESSIPFTKGRWRKCRAICDGLEKLHEALNELLGDEKSIAQKLDALGDQPLMLASLRAQEKP